MPQSIRRRAAPLPPPPPVGTPPPDRFVTEMRVGGLFHRTNAHITFGRNKNFLIGPNGSGKTTIVHILASCLRNDFTQLFELPFRTAEITLTGTVSPKETKVAIAQRYNTESGRRTLNVSITGDYQHSEDIELRATQQLPAWTGDLEDDDNQRIASTTAGLAQIVRLLTNTTWLSVHRGEIRQPGPVGQNLVDRHLDSISRRFAQFNSRRNTLLGNENTEFQRRMFLSFLTPRISLATLRSLASLDIDERIQQLRAILRQLGVGAAEAEANLSRYHDDLERAVSASKRRRQGRMGFSEEATLLSVSQANDVISSWSEYQRKVAGINEGVTELLTVLREYFDKKQVTLSDRGQLFFAASLSGRVTQPPSPHTNRPAPPILSLRPHQLSSGEKQIYIFLMEALLQRELISIFIADEPELSLHVAWQERLVNSILRLSPNAQLIFATHSPDIVGSDQDAIIEMEKVIENA